MGAVASCYLKYNKSIIGYIFIEILTTLTLSKLKWSLNLIKKINTKYWRTEFLDIILMTRQICHLKVKVLINQKLNLRLYHWIINTLNGYCNKTYICSWFQIIENLNQLI